MWETYSVPCTLSHCGALSGSIHIDDIDVSTTLQHMSSLKPHIVHHAAACANQALLLCAVCAQQQSTLMPCACMLTTTCHRHRVSGALGDRGGQPGRRS